MRCDETISSWYIQAHFKGIAWREYLVMVGKGLIVYFVKKNFFGAYLSLETY